ncbi:MAG: hypothetical protein GX102_08155 [Porphyromonadaceae bacterium]|nr:hypothetical protein [Porphyromonadaceae bacterium]
MTPYAAAYRFPTMLEDIIYRNTVAAQNVGYNQPTQLRCYYFNLSNYPSVNNGRIGLRQMSCRASMYSNFRVSVESP